jgi:hypothetical protein
VEEEEEEDTLLIPTACHDSHGGRLNSRPAHVAKL